MNGDDASIFESADPVRILGYGNTVTLRVGNYVRTDRVVDGATYRPYVALCDIMDGQMVYENEIARPNSGRARYWAARLKFRNRPNRAKRRVIYAKWQR